MKPIDRNEELQERYQKLYTKIEDSIKEAFSIKSLMEICSVEIDRTGKPDQINVRFLEDIRLNVIGAVQKRFDKYSVDFNFKMNYPGVHGNPSVFE